MSIHELYPVRSPHQSHVTGIDGSLKGEIAETRFEQGLLDEDMGENAVTDSLVDEQHYSTLVPAPAAATSVPSEEFVPVSRKPTSPRSRGMWGMLKRSAKVVCAESPDAELELHQKECATPSKKTRYAKKLHCGSQHTVSPSTNTRVQMTDTMGKEIMSKENHEGKREETSPHQPRSSSPSQEEGDNLFVEVQRLNLNDKQTFGSGNSCRNQPPREGPRRRRRWTRSKALLKAGARGARAARASLRGGKRDVDETKFPSHLEGDVSMSGGEDDDDENPNSHGDHNLTIQTHPDMYENMKVLHKRENVAVMQVRSPEGEVLVKKVVSLKARPNEDPEMECEVYDTIQRKGGHENILRKKEHYRDGVLYVIILEYVEGGNYFKAMEASGDHFTPDIIRQHFREITMGLKFLHEKGFANLDLSPENILIKDGKPLLMDFGASLRASDRVTSVRGKRRYAAPEVFMASQQNPCNPLKADMWSLGVLLLFMLMGGKLFWGEACDRDEVFRNMKCWCNQGEDFGNVMEIGIKNRGLEFKFQHHSLDLLKRLLQLDPEKRLSLNEVLAHPYCNF